jgi:uncharacterized membrane protein YdbT with pleckstrin-like domain
MSAEHEAKIRRKPKRILHNQLLIRLLIVANIVSPFLIVGLMFNIFPYTIKALLLTWIISACSYAVFWTRARIIERKTKR